MGDVSGTVTLDGQPVKAAAIYFTSDFARATRGKVREGQIVELTTFELNDGVPAGHHRVTIKPVYEAVDDYMKPKATGPVTPIPAKFSELTRTPLTADITKGDNALSFELTSK